jgi:peroxiredoxin
LLLAAVFALAAVAKLADRAGSRRSVAEFGVPSALAGSLAVLLPLAELTVAAALIPATTAWWGAVGAMGLLLLFTVGIGVNLARGRRPDCHCFGQLHSAPAGWSTLARNGALTAVAALVVIQPEGDAGPSMVSWAGALSTMQLLSLIGGLIVLGLLGAQWWFLLALLRQNGRLLVRLGAVEERLAAAGLAPPVASQNGGQSATGLPVGTPAPAFRLQDLRGEDVTLDFLRAAGKPVVLIFTDPDCAPCSELLPQIARWQLEYAEKLTISLVSQESTEENRVKVAKHGVHNILLQEDWEVAEAYHVQGTPSAVVVSPEGTIDSLLGEGPDRVEALIAHAVGVLAQRPTLRSTVGHAAQEVVSTRPKKVGESAPEFELSDLEGQTVSLQDFKGEQTLLLFWSPDCGFCQQMLPDLKEWEANRPKGAPGLLAVSAGTEEANREMDLTSTVVLDQQFAVGRAFGASGTPSAVLVDAEGKVASEVAVGAPAVLELAGSRQTKA